MDWQSGLFHRIVPIRVVDRAFDSWYYTARCHRWNQVLYYTQLLKTNGIGGKYLDDGRELVNVNRLYAQSSIHLFVYGLF